MAQETNILIRGYYGKKNLGDDYILYSILKMLNDISPKHDISVIVETLGDDYRWLFPRFENIECRAVPIRQNSKFAQNKDTKQYTKGTQLFIIGGGGLFPNLSWKMSAALYVDTLFAKIHHAKILIYGIDISRMSGVLSKVFWKKTAKNCVAIGLRNEYSKNLLEMIGIKNAISLTDLTFCVSTSVENNSKKVDSLEECLGIKGEKYAIFALANPFSKQELTQKKFSDRLDLLTSQLIQARDQYEKNGFRLVFLPFFSGSDFSLIQKVANKNRDIIIKDNQLDIEEKRALFIHASAALSMRFHGIAFSLFHGTPCTAICYAPKSIELMKETGLEDYAIKYGIRATDSFFDEFDLNMEQMNQINQKVMISPERNRFINASKCLHEKAEKTKQLLETAIANLRTEEKV